MAGVNRYVKVLAAASVIAIGIGLLTSPASASETPGPGAPGLGDRLYPLNGNGGYDVDHYDLRLRYPAKDPAQQVTGDVTITAHATQALSRFDLDFAGDGVGSVSVDG